MYNVASTTVMSYSVTKTPAGPVSRRAAGYVDRIGPAWGYVRAATRRPTPIERGDDTVAVTSTQSGYHSRCWEALGCVSRTRVPSSAYCTVPGRLSKRAVHTCMYACFSITRRVCVNAVTRSGRAPPWSNTVTYCILQDRWRKLCGWPSPAMSGGRETWSTDERGSSWPPRVCYTQRSSTLLQLSDWASFTTRRSGLLEGVASRSVESCIWQGMCSSYQ
nr:hypothetical protein CFP56_04515 [Quercus suber]